MSEYEFEPVPGLPEQLPEGENVIWRGSPDARAVARHALHGVSLAAFFAVIAFGGVLFALAEGATAAAALAATHHVVLMGLAAAAAVFVLSRLIQKTTIYTITNKRVVMRFGIALPMTLNIPFEKIASAGVKLSSGGTGDIALLPSGPLPLSYVHLWPHARGFELKQPQPALRCIPDAGAVAEVLVRALAAQGVQGELRLPAQPERSGTGRRQPAHAMPATA